MDPRPRPPSPVYFRQFLRRWCGADDAASFVVLADSKKCPRQVGEAVHVGDEWLRAQAIPRSALEGGDLMPGQREMVDHAPKPEHH